MANPFSSIETSINAGVIGALGNATLTWGAYSAGGVWSHGYADSLGMVNAEKTFTALSADLPAIAQGASVTLASVAYTVQAIEPDGTGMIRLSLRKS